MIIVNSINKFEKSAFESIKGGGTTSPFLAENFTTFLSDDLNYITEK